MYREQVISKLKEAEPALRARGVAALYLFGSVARDEVNSGSDVDVFIDPRSDQQFGFLQFMDVYETIQQAVGRNVEVGYSTRSGLSRYVKDDIERDSLKIF
jgi:predicted nucleotidyltransferase